MPAKKVLVDLDFQSIARGVNVPNPIAAGDIANKQYVDSVAQGLQLKASVRAATTSSETSVISSAPAAIDGINLAATNRVLVKNQANPVQNGIYVFNGIGVAMTRVADLPTASSAKGVFVFVEEGAQNADSGWVCSNDTGSDVVGTAGLIFTQFSGAGSVTAGSALAKTGSTLDVNVDGTTIQVNGSNQLEVVPAVAFGNHKATASVGNGVLTTFTVNHTLNTRDVTVSVRDTATHEHVIADVVATTTTSVTINFNSPPTTNQFAVTIIG
jgi:hypothetical protein